MPTSVSARPRGTVILQGNMATEQKITEQDVLAALERVEDPEIGKPITELDMVESVRIDGADVAVGIYLTIAGCPMRDTIEGNTCLLYTSPSPRD